MGILLQEIEKLAKDDNVQDLFISTDHTGLYEKFGYEFHRMMQDIHGESSRIYRKHVK